jgi:hypothetical protein
MYLLMLLLTAITFQRVVILPDLSISQDEGAWHSIIDNAKSIDLRLSGDWSIDGRMLVGDSGDRPGSLASFGSQVWQDYELDFHLTMESGKNASVFTRRSLDGKQFYATNTLAARKVFRVAEFDQTREQPGRDLSIVAFDFQEGTEYHVRILVQGDSIKTYVDDHLVNSAVDGTLRSGSAAFALWYCRVTIRDPRYRLLD